MTKLHDKENTESTHNSIDKHDKNKKSNWPRFMISTRSQVFFGMISIVLSFVSGLGIFPASYYTFYLDKKNKKSGIAKALNISAIIIPLLGLIITVILSQSLKGFGLI